MSVDEILKARLDQLDSDEERLAALAALVARMKRPAVVEALAKVVHRLDQGLPDDEKDLVLEAQDVLRRLRSAVAPN